MSGQRENRASLCLEYLGSGQLQVVEQSAQGLGAVAVAGFLGGRELGGAAAHALGAEQGVVAEAAFSRGG